MQTIWITVCIVATVASSWLTQAQSADSETVTTPTGEPMYGKGPGEVRDHNGLKMKLVWCPPGFVTMENVEHVTERAAEKEGHPNDDDEIDSKDEPAPQPRQTEKIAPVKVFVTKGYWLGKFEVTQSQWIKVMRTEPWKGQDFTKDGAEFPATWVNWQDASDFCSKFTEEERQAGRLPNEWEYMLPTEAQWERACRARTETRFSFGDDESKLGDYAWFGDNTIEAGEKYAHGVGQKRPNPWGLCDMHGNAWEWCRDIYTVMLPGGRDPDVKSDEKTKSAGRVFKGGSWVGGAAMSRSGSRYGGLPIHRHYDFGFRVALCAAGPAR